jgi:hypothetical protein
VLAKLITGVGVAGLFWLVSTGIDLVAGGLFLHAQGYSTQLGSGAVLRSIGLDLLAYLLWALFGIGIGALLRNQLAATVSATVLYLAGIAAASTVFELLNTYVLQRDWVLTAQVVVPAVASAVMISPTKTFDQSPPQWVGAVVLLTYGLLAAAIGTRLLRRRDVA